MRRAVWGVRVASGVYVGLPTQEGGRGPVVAAVSDATHLQTSLALCDILTAEIQPVQGFADFFGFMIAPLHPVSAARLRNIITECLRLICRLPLMPIGRFHEHVRGVRVVWSLLRCITLLACQEGARLTPVSLDSSLSGEEQTLLVLARYARVASEISSVLAGRLLTISELQDVLESTGVEADRVATTVAVDALSILGRLEMHPAVERRIAKRARCARCGSASMLRHTDGCPICVGLCARCTCCSSLGVMTACTWLFHMPATRSARSEHDGAQIILDIPFPLTEVQKRASRRVQAFVESRGPGEFLVWAACGAGKTEVACAAIASELARGGTVLYVVPRRTVASDLHSRLSRFFPNTEIGLRSGDRRLGSSVARFAVCTSHQTLRLKHWADLVVFDEVDAFPFEPGGYLEWSVKRSRRPGGKLVYLTATPDASMFERVGARKLPFCLVSTRHHGRPVPVPEIVSVATSHDGERDSPHMCRTHTDKNQDRPSNHPCALEHLEPKDLAPFSVHELCLLCLAATVLSPTLVFVPTIELVERARDIVDGALRGCFGGARFGYCHSRLQHNDEVIEALRQGRLASIVTTTVLERGITIPGVNVIVLRADSPVFDARSLVQIAGRAGRTTACPTGRVLFAVNSVTSDVKRSIDMIEFMNARLGQ